MLRSSATLVDWSGDELQAAELIGTAAVLALFFAAEGCPRCRTAQQRLLECFTALRRKRAYPLEVVYIPCEIVGGPPGGPVLPRLPIGWFALPVRPPEPAAELRQRLHITSVPHIVFINQTGEVICRDGRALVQCDAATGFAHTWSILQKVDCEARARALLAGSTAAPPPPRFASGPLPDPPDPPSAAAGAAAAAGPAPGGRRGDADRPRSGHRATSAGRPGTGRSSSGPAAGSGRAAARDRQR
eukprot:TRINITY_DN9280_c4_g1_i1.p1 TRINITY_DN9280_c4_g1~~TRINITY_DN9280_c4_g1_i1.p1  ORF type:complete len:244 (+),score=44.54 TRINITY_DN9280_c4_g1_i1:125-856(+)